MTDNGHGTVPPQMQPPQPVVVAQVVAHPNGMVQLVIDPQHPDPESVQLLVMELALTAQKQNLQRRRQQEVDDGGVDIVVPGKGTLHIGGKRKAG